jgi:hypothetical protein
MCQLTINNEDGCLLGCGTVEYGGSLPTFQKLLLPPGKAARTSETLVNFNQATRRYNPEDTYLRIHHRENLKSYYKQCLLT